MYAVFGNPIEHSLSPVIISKFLNIECNKFTLKEDISKFELKNLLKKNNIIYGNVTYPYKSLFYKYSDKTIFPANIIENVNAFLFIDDNIISTSTDGEGFFLSLYYSKKEIYKRLLNDRIILIAGNGATAKAIGYSAKIRGIMPIYISRKAQSENLTEKFFFEKIINYKTACELLKKIDYTVIVSTLPFSILNLIYETKKLKSDDIKSFFEIAREKDFNIFDSNYKDYIEIKESQKSITNNTKIHNGVDQLIGQALISIYFFTKMNFLNNKDFAQTKDYIFKNLM